MKIYKNLKIKNKHKNSVVAIGNFDGIHLGHKKVIGQAKKKAKKYKLPFGLITFEPMPVMFFNPFIVNHRINSLDQKIEDLQKLKIDFLIIIKFDKSFSSQSAKNFIEKILLKIKSKFIFVSKTSDRKKKKRIYNFEKFSKYMNTKLKWLP